MTSRSHFGDTCVPCVSCIADPAGARLGMSSRAIFRVSRPLGGKVSFRKQAIEHHQEADQIGKNDGQVIMIKNNGQVEAYQVSYQAPEPVSQLTGTVAIVWKHLATNRSSRRCDRIRQEATIRRKRIRLRIRRRRFRGNASAKATIQYFW